MFNISPTAKPSIEFCIFSSFAQDAWRDSTQTTPSPKYKNCFESGSWCWNLFKEKTKSRRLFRPDFVNKNNSQSRSTKGKDPNWRFSIICRQTYWYIFERLPRTIWRKTDGPKNIFTKRIGPSTTKTWSQWLQMTHGGTILKDSREIGQFLALCSHFHPAILRNFGGLIRVKIRAKHQKSFDCMRVFQN